MSTLGTKLLKLRQEHKLSQTEIADILGVKQTTYSGWESDEVKPKSENLFKLSQYYKINMQELFDENDKISMINHDNNNNGGNNIFANENNTVNIQQSPEIIELLKNEEENIFKLIASQQEQQAQTTKLLESHFKLVELMNKKN